MLNFFKLLFYSTLILGTLITISSYSWFSIWMGLEINLLSILPLMVDNKNSYPSEAALKYFVTQVVASSLLLFSMIFSLIAMEFSFSNYQTLMDNLMNLSFFIALLMKMGAAPFHLWFPEVLEGLNWTNNLIMLIWQKIGPMVITLLYSKNSLFLMSIIVVSTIVGSILGLNQTSLRKILAYSSINHMAWMISTMVSVKMVWLFYFSIYSITTISIIWIFSKFNIYFLNQLHKIYSKNKNVNWLIASNFLSLGGIPPFLGFLPKWLTILSLSKKSLFLVSILLILFTLIVLFFYLRLTFTAFMLTKNETFFWSRPNFLMYTVNFMVLFSLPLVSLTYF
uniref:NADH-ubiquinone oxidoreductase chain 2 n=1 Tax=Crioceris duodecimpunctata TaxID=184539 RepID=Q8WB21_CRIDU|nr:NADH dehydrogenase subunit 2 [Crioceris duodecimpunctata]AAL67861.1 NADH dehydrogenase subunit 2 [Crioceris duodecimpunctata]